MPYSRRQFIRQSGLVAGTAAVGLPLYSTTQHINTKDGDRLILLGTQGGPVIRSSKSRPSANLIVYKNISYIVDTGYGITLKLLEAGIHCSHLDIFSLHIIILITTWNWEHFFIMPGSLAYQHLLMSMHRLG